MIGTTEDVLEDQPAWVPKLVAVPPIIFGVAGVVGIGPAWPVVAVAVAVAVTPWVLRAAGASLPIWLFATWVLVPIAVVNLAGDSLGVDLSGDSHTQFTLMILVWLAGEMAVRASASAVAVSTVAVISVMVGRTFVEPEFGHSWMFWVGGAGIALVTGFMLRRQHQMLAQLRRAQAALADEAADRERQRIAREIHDVVAHTLTVTLMQLQAARRVLDNDPSELRAALEEAESLARRSLADIRRTVGLLRTQHEEPETRALPDAGDIPELLSSYRSAGVELSAELDVDLDRLGPAPGLTLYRLVQESLSNAAKHASGAPIGVSIYDDGSHVELAVVNDLVNPDGRGSTDGLGLVGMQERVRLLGGDLRAGPEDGRWRVHARFPLQSVHPPSESVL